MIVAALLSPESARIAILVALAVCYACYHGWRWRMQHPKVRTEEPPKPTEPEAEPSCELDAAPIAVRTEAPQTAAKSGAERGGDATSTWTRHLAALREGSGLSERGGDTASTGAGEEDFRRARAMPHQEIPDYRIDGLYLDLLGDSAEKGYAPAMAKLGEYAMRRGCNVEAYYWLWRAKRRGMPNLDAVLREIRMNWILAGSSDESRNVYELFSEEAGSIGRALLSINSGRDAYAAREYLKSHHPEFLDA